MLGELLHTLDGAASALPDSRTRRVVVPVRARRPEATPQVKAFALLVPAIRSPAIWQRVVATLAQDQPADNPALTKAPARRRRELGSAQGRARLVRERGCTARERLLSASGATVNVLTTAAIVVAL